MFRRLTPDRQPDPLQRDLKALLPRLWRFAYVLSRSRTDAEDLVQATCVRILERRHQFTGQGRFESWAFAVMASVWKNHVRAERIRLGEGHVEAEEVLVFDGAQSAETNIFFRQVLEQIQDLPEGQRAAVLLVYGEGLSYAEAANALGVPIGTIMSRLANARKLLAHLRHDSPEPREPETP
ncbi:MAG: RNA polymerase sigma factor [Pseudomonadota bacterium]